MAFSPPPLDSAIWATTFICEGVALYALRLPQRFASTRALKLYLAFQMAALAIMVPVYAFAPEWGMYWAYLGITLLGYGAELNLLIGVFLDIRGRTKVWRFSSILDCSHARFIVSGADFRSTRFQPLSLVPCSDRIHETRLGYRQDDCTCHCQCLRLYDGQQLAAFNSIRLARSRAIRFTRFRLCRAFPVSPVLGVVPQTRPRFCVFCFSYPVVCTLILAGLCAAPATPFRTSGHGCWS